MSMAVFKNFKDDELIVRGDAYENIYDYFVSDCNRRVAIVADRISNLQKRH